MTKKLLFCLLMWVMCMPAFAQEETLTVFDGTTEGTGTDLTIKTNDFVPAFTRKWNKAGTKSQIIIPAQFLTQMKGGDISSVKFYSTSYNTPHTTASTADVYVGEVDYIAFNANESHFDFEPKENCTIIYQGNITIDKVGPTNQEHGEMTITFNSPYKYRGGNLLIGFENTTTAGWKRFLFKGQNVMWHAGLAGDQETATYYYKQQCDFIPWTTFTYTPGSTPEEFYMVGTFNGWQTGEGDGRLTFAATDTDDVYETTGTLEDGAEFKVITPNGDDWTWLGGIDENQVGYFLINNDLLNVPLTMIDGSNFRMENGGEYTFSVNAIDMTLTVLPIGNPVIPGDVNGDGQVSAVDITVLYNFLLDSDTEFMVNGDQNGDGEVTSVDVTIVYNILLGD